MSTWSARWSARWSPILLAAFVMTSSVAHAAAYRCEDAGRVTYTNLPCPSGRQVELALDRDAPAAADRADAEARLRADRSRLATLEKERRQDERAAAITAKRGTDRGRHADTCTKLALRAKRAREDVDQSNARDRTARQTRARRANEDLAALCKRR